MRDPVIANSVPDKRRQLKSALGHHEQTFDQALVRGLRSTQVARQLIPAISSAWAPCSYLRLRHLAQQWHRLIPIE